MSSLSCGWSWFESVFLWVRTASASLRRAFPRVVLRALRPARPLVRMASAAAPKGGGPRAGEASPPPCAVEVAEFTENILARADSLNLTAAQSRYFL